jgi:hypothetical protein
MFGMEIETRIPITMTPGKIKLMTSKKFNVVRDSHPGFGTVVEFVMHPVGEGATLDATLTEFNARFALIKTAAEALAKAVPGKKLIDLLKDSVPDTPDRKFTADCATAEIRQVAADTYEQDAPMVSKSVALDIRNLQDRPAAIALRSRLHGPVHYTAGFALRTIPRLIRERLTAGVKPHNTRKRALEAVAIAERLTAQPIAQVDMDVVAGYLALVYLQIAAVQDAVQASAQDWTLTKNHTLALCRVPLGQIYNDLANMTQTCVIYLGGDFLNAVAVNLGPEDEWSAGALLLRDGAFTGKVIRPDAEKIFGGMTVIASSETVDPAGQQRGYALELRHSPTGYGNLATVREQAEDLLRYVWNLHDPATQTGRAKSTDDSAPAPSRAVRSRTRST